MILVQNLEYPRINFVEIVERKGIGHPDCLADGICEELSRNFCLHSLKKYGLILRYFFDKTFIYGGKSKKSFLNGEMTKPFKIIVSSMVPDNESDSIKDFIEKNVKNYLRDSLHEFRDEYCEVNFSVYTTPKMFYESERASDSSIATGYYPLSKLEEIVLATEQFLNKKTKDEIIFLGEDIKILGLRDNKKIDLILACPFISKYIKNRSDYQNKKIFLKNEISCYIQRKFQEDIENFSIEINPDDKDEIYLSFIGSCVDSSASGISGKGNSINGLKSLFRPQTPEAVFGKNIVRHPGRIYNIVSFLIAKKISETFNLKECYVHIIGKVGDPILDPDRIIIEPLGKIDLKKSQRICDSILNKIDRLRLELLKENLCKNPMFLYQLKV